MIKKIITSPYFYIPAVLAGITLLLLWLRKRKCETGVWFGKSQMVNKACSFWTGNPKDESPLGKVYTLTVSKQTGAVIYEKQSDGTFKATDKTVPFDTKLKGEFFTDDKVVFYKTKKGWLNPDDISIDTLAPH
jgi:hypothetical protein